MGAHCCGCSYERRTSPIRVLILGLASCGKSTFLRQLQIKNNVFTDELNFRDVAYQNLISGIQELVRQCHACDLSFEQENAKRARFLNEVNLGEVVYDDEIFQRIVNLWNDPAIQECWNNRHTFPMQIRHMDYLMQNMDRIRSPDYVPTKEDCVYLRQRTTGTFRVQFTSNKFLWEFIDVGGQASERAKWELIVDNEKLDAVVFIVSVDEFSVIKDHQNNLHSAIKVFGEVMNTGMLKTIPKVLFLNKLDLFKQHLNLETGWLDFQKAFPDFHLTTSNNDDANNNINIKAGLDHIKRKFKDEFPDLRTESIRCGSCLDSDFVGHVFEVICQTYLDASVMASLN